MPLAGEAVGLAPTHPLQTASGSAFRGISLMILSGMFGVSMSAAIRHVSLQLHPFEIALFRNIFGFLILLPLIVRSGGLRVFSTPRLGLHLLRGAFQAVGVLTFFLALGLAPLADVVALNFTAPLFAVLLATLVLRERIGVRRCAGLAIGFLGVLIILRPGSGAIGLGGLVMLLAAAAWGCALVVTKSLTRTESSLTITAYGTLCVAALSLPAALLYWQWPTAEGLGWLVLIGLLGSVMQLCLAQAFAESDANVVLPFDFLKLVWACALGYLLFGERPDLWTYLGGTAIFASATYVAYRERDAAPNP